MMICRARQPETTVAMTILDILCLALRMKRKDRIPNCVQNEKRDMKGIRMSILRMAPKSVNGSEWNVALDINRAKLTS